MCWRPEEQMSYRRPAACPRRFEEVERADDTADALQQRPKPSDGDLEGVGVGLSGVVIFFDVDRPDGLRYGFPRLQSSALSEIHIVQRMLDGRYDVVRVGTAIRRPTIVDDHVKVNGAPPDFALGRGSERRGWSGRHRWRRRRRRRAGQG